MAIKINLARPLLFAVIATTLVVSENALARSIEVASGSQCIDSVKTIEAAYETQTGNDLKHTHENGMTFASVMMALDNGKAELAVIAFSWENAQKEITDKDIKVKNLGKIQAFPIGKVKQVFFTHPSGPAKLTAENIQRIGKGEVSNWKELGGEDLPIVVAYQSNTTATQGIISKTYLAGEPLNKKTWKQFTSYPETVAFVKETKGAISFGPESAELKGVRVPQQPELVRHVVGLTVGDPTPEAKQIIDLAAKSASK